MFGPKLERLLFFIAFVVLTLLIGKVCAHAQNLASAPTIFDVRRSLPLEPDEEAYKDFYINAGPEAGFRKGQYLSVVRLVPVHDPVQNKQQATLTVNVAKLQVIQTERNITVARLQSELTDDDRPTLEYESIMIGDRIDTASSTMDAPTKKKPKAKASKEVALEDTVTASVTIASTQAPVAPEVATNTNKSPSPVAAAADMVRVPVPAPAPAASSPEKK